jgi:hypothetical protein
VDSLIPYKAVGPLQGCYQQCRPFCAESTTRPCRWLESGENTNPIPSVSLYYTNLETYSPLTYSQAGLTALAALGLPAHEPKDLIREFIGRTTEGGLTGASGWRRPDWWRWEAIRPGLRPGAGPRKKPLALTNSPIILHRLKCTNVLVTALAVRHLALRLSKPDSLATKDRGRDRVARQPDQRAAFRI